MNIQPLFYLLHSRTLEARLVLLHLHNSPHHLFSITMPIEIRDGVKGKQIRWAQCTGGCGTSHEPSLDHELSIAP